MDEINIRPAENKGEGSNFGYIIEWPVDWECPPTFCPDKDSLLEELSEVINVRGF